MTTFDDIPTDAEITGDVYRDCLNRVWVRTWQGWESASEPVIRKSIASIPGLVELVPVTEFVQAIDWGRDTVWLDGRGQVRLRSSDASPAPGDHEPLYCRVTEPAGSVTT